MKGKQEVECELFMKAPVIIEEYNPIWPLLYEDEKNRICNVIGEKCESIEHVGSTSVSGLGAKPIIDIMIGFRTLSDAEECIKPMIKLGYEYIKEHEEEIPERRFLTQGSRSEGRTHHAHMVETSSEFWIRLLMFRDYLRTHPDVAEDYYKLKKKLANQYQDNRRAYTDSKTSFILAIEKKINLQNN